MKYILLSVSIFISISIQSQYIPKLSVKISGGTISDARIYTYPYVNDQYPGGSWIDKKKVPHFRIETCYLINEETEVGLYLGISQLTVPINPNDIYDTTSGTTSGYFYGSQINYHFLPLLVKRPIRFDFYGTAKIGMITKSWRGFNNQTIYKDNVFEIGAGIGTAFYFTRNFGLFGEVLCGKLYNSIINWRGGLTFKF